MRAILKAGVLVLAPESRAERDEVAAWRETVRDHVFHVGDGVGDGVVLHDMGLRAEACREPINVVFKQVDPRWRSISNLAHTPFALCGLTYASVEAFWQGLRREDADERGRIASLWGLEAKRAVASDPAWREFRYDGRMHQVGGPSHRALMLRACRAKFSQHSGAREALLSTGSRPLAHRTRRDSETIPGAVMAEYWMRIRADLRAKHVSDGSASEH